MTSPVLPAAEKAAASAGVLEHKPNASKRLPELDALRGLMLIGMTLTHLPTFASHYFYQPMGFVAWAEGFILISAILTGKIYGRSLGSEFSGPMLRRLWRRAGKLYVHHVALLAIAFTIVAAVAVRTQQPALLGLLDFYLAHRAVAVWSSLLLVYCPPLLDILPMYIAFLLLTPFALYVGKRWGWKFVLIPSGLLWLGAQFGVREAIYALLVRFTGVDIPLKNLGPFNTYAWQLVWIVGLWLGTGGSPHLAVRLKNRWTVALAALTTILFLVLRYQWILASHPVDQGPAWVLFDKWQLGIVRLVNFVSLGILFVRFRAPIARYFAVAPLVLLGKASLEVFSSHVVFCFAALSLVGDGLSASRAQQVWILAGCFLVLYTVAYLKKKKTVKEKRGYALLPQPQE